MYHVTSVHSTEKVVFSLALAIMYCVLTVKNNIYNYYYVATTCQNQRLHV